MKENKSSERGYSKGERKGGGREGTEKARRKTVVSLQNGRSFTFSRSRGARKKRTRDVESTFPAASVPPTLSLLFLLVGDRFTFLRRFHFSLSQSIFASASESVL